MARVWLLARTIAVAAAILAPAAAQSQTAEPRTLFTNALARFSLALEGQHGDEGPTVLAGLDTMDRVRQQWDATIRAYEARMTSELGTADAALATQLHLALGGTYLDRFRLTDAVREFDEALRVDPKRPEVLTVRGLARLQIEATPAGALDDFRRAADLAPGDAVGAYLLGRQLVAIAAQEGAAARALEQFVAARGALPATGPISAPFVHLGVVQEVPGIEPFFPPALYAEGFQLLQQGRYDAAISRFRTAAILDPLVTPQPDTAEPVRQAAAALRDGAADVAIARLAEAAARTPGATEVHRMLGLAYLAADKVDEGLDALVRSVELDPSYERPRLDLARAYVEHGELENAAKVLADTLETIPDSGRARYLLGMVRERQGNPDRAMQALEQAAELRPLLGLNSVYQALGALRRSQQDYQGAIEAFSRRVVLVPNDAAAHHELAEMYFRRSALVEALAEYTVALMLDPGRAESQVGVGQVRLRQGRFEEAADAARRAIEVDGNHKEARYVLGTALLRLGRTDDGNRELQTYQRLQAEATALQSKRLELAGYRRDATVSSARGDFNRAVELLQRALAADPSDASSELDLGIALLRAGKAGEAVAHLKAGVVSGGSPEVHRYLAEAYEATGQAEDGRRERSLYAQTRQEALRRAGAAR